MNNILIHIPHSSLYLPLEFMNRCLLNKNYLNSENIFISDYLIDTIMPNNLNILKFEYSRLYCDVERFKDDKKEIMSKYGQGMIYELDSNKNKIIKIDKNYKKYIIKNIYDKHHKLLDNKVTEILNQHNKCIIIDLHSYSDEFVYKMFKKENNPDICIGIDDNFTSKILIDIVTKIIDKYGYTYQINYPYSGTIIPNKYFNDKNSNIDSIMIEVNKRIYLDNNITLNIEKHNKLKKCMIELLDNLEKYDKINNEMRDIYGKTKSLFYKGNNK